MSKVPLFPLIDTEEVERLLAAVEKDEKDRKGMAQIAAAILQKLDGAIYYPEEEDNFNPKMAASLYMQGVAEGLDSSAGAILAMIESLGEAIEQGVITEEADVKGTRLAMHQLAMLGKVLATAAAFTIEAAKKVADKGEAVEVKPGKGVEA